MTIQVKAGQSWSAPLINIAPCDPYVAPEKIVELSLLLKPVVSALKMLFYLAAAREKRSIEKVLLGIYNQYFLTLIQDAFDGI